MHLIFFDIDGTLVTTAGAGVAAMTQAAAELGARDNGDYQLNAAGRSDRSITMELFEHFQVPDEPANRQAFSDRYMELLATYLEERRGRVLPGIEPLLKALAARNDVALGLLTGNYRRSAQVKLEFYGIWDYFPFGGFGDNSPLRDDIAREALAEASDLVEFSIHPERLWVIGDTPHDITCSRAIGARVMAVGTGRFSAKELSGHDPDAAFEDLSDLDDVLGWLLPE